jgi:hypothetical protein
MDAARLLPQIRALAGLACAALAMRAVAGGEMGGPDELMNDAVVIFGFVKDSRGAPVADANVKAKLGSTTMYVRTDATGAYKLPLFDKKIDPKDVVISCEKTGYKQIRVSRRPPVVKPDAPITVETECRLERG